MNENLMTKIFTFKFEGMKKCLREFVHMKMFCCKIEDEER